jgi:hypothetical protein
VGADIVRKALTYPMKLIANNAGVNGSVVMQKVIDSNDSNYGYNAATDKFEDLMESGIIDPTKVGGFSCVSRCFFFVCVCVCVCVCVARTHVCPCVCLCMCACFVCMDRGSNAWR